MLKTRNRTGKSKSAWMEPGFVIHRSPAMSVYFIDYACPPQRENGYPASLARATAAMPVTTVPKRLFVFQATRKVGIDARR